MPGELGHSLRLDNGDLSLEDGKLAEVGGYANLAQALTLRVLTPLGSDQFNTSYGFDAHGIFAQPAGARAVRDLITLNLVRTITADRRVREVRDVVFPDAAEARQRRSWTVHVSIVALDGQPSTLTLKVGI